MTTRPSRVPVRSIWVVLIAVALMTAAFWMLKQSSSPVVKADTGLGGPLPNLTPLEITLFNTGFTPFSKLWDVPQGLGPVFTQITCLGCHGFVGTNPVPGGNSNKRATFFGKINGDGSFNPMTEEGGMVLQPRSVALFKPGCVLPGEVIPTDATVVVKRLPPELFGLGLVDSIPDSSILAQAVDKGMGIHGSANMVNDEKGNLRVGKYGYKAQDATLLQFSSDALTHELGITNPIFPLEDKPQGKAIPPGCAPPREPNDDGTQMLAIFQYLLYLAPNTPGTPNANGQALFSSIGCANCHLPTYMTGNQIVVPVVWQGRTIISKALSNKPVNLYSDLLVHNMGGDLADGLPLGLAGPNMFRTTPLWGLSTRIPPQSNNGILHDGRTTDVNKAIRIHGGEATQVINNFKALSPLDQADLIAFISSL